MGVEEQPQRRTRAGRPEDLTDDVAETLDSRHPPRRDKAERDGWVQMRAGDVAEGVDHRHHHQTECQRDADVRDRPARNVVDHDRAGAGEDEAEGAEKL